MYLSEPILLRLLRGERRDRVPEPPPVLGQGLVARAAPLAEPPGPPPDVPPHVPRQQPLELLAPDARPLPAVEELWIGYIFLDDFGRTKPAFLNSTGVMYPSVECILKLLYQCT